ncbi:BTAD domain-containing putative transcriptional regulator [Virgisporangium ochraceum]|nr:BTAD domain-containing putative transcriptional regulator [Virgisporangium ochraceum]
MDASMKGRAEQVSDTGAAIRRRRLAAGLTQQELADASGVSVRTVRDIEQGRVDRPRAASVRRLVEALVPGPGSAGVSVDVLGPLSVTRDGRPVELRGTLTRGLLGLLALQAGETVATASIVAALWGERPPRTCRTQIHRAVNQIRDALEPDRQPREPGDLIRLEPGGYVLALDAERVDASRFRSLVERARDGGVDALALLDEALRCWRGPVLADAPATLHAQPVVAAVERQRLSAVLALADLALDAGRPDVAAAHVRDLAAVEPLHEGLHARQMLLLAAGGEQAAALRLYTELRDRLVGELGVEPGPELRAAQLRVLRSDAAPAAAGSAVPVLPSTAEPVRPVPGQLPAGVRAFAGRQRQLAALDAHLAAAAPDRPPAPVVVVGPAGVGKSALATHWAHRVRGRFPDGQLHIDLQGFHPSGAALDPGAVLRGFLQALGVPPHRVPPDLSGQVGLYRTVTAGRRLLVVLDNARDADHVRTLLPAEPGCLAVVTSRSPMLGLVASDEAHLVELDPLPAGEATDLLAGRLGRDRLAAEPSAAADIVRRCGGLPVALAVAAARAAGQPALPLAALADELRRERDSLQPFDLGDTTTDVRAVFSWSYRTLGPAAARTFRHLGLHPGPSVGAAAVASMVGAAPAEVGAALTELVGAHLVTRVRAGRYGLHDLFRAYAAEVGRRTDSAAGTAAARRRLYDHHLATAYRAALRLNPHRRPFPSVDPGPSVVPESVDGYADAVAWFTAELPTVLTLVDEAVAAGLPVHGWRLGWTVLTFLRRDGRWHDLARVTTAALACAEDADDVLGRAHAERGRALAWAGMGGGAHPAADAHAALERALTHFTTAGDRVGQGETHLDLASALQHLGERATALAHAERALELFRAAGYEYGEANARNSIGWHHADLGRYDLALAHCLAALSRLEELGDRYGQAATSHSVGYAYQRLGRHTEAIVHYRRAARLSEEAGDRYHRAMTLANLGETYQATGDRDAARAAYAEALRVLTDLDHPDAEPVRKALAAL